MTSITRTEIGRAKLCAAAFWLVLSAGGLLAVPVAAQSRSPRTEQSRSQGAQARSQAEQAASGGGVSKPKKAQVGAGTTAGTTTGSSQAMANNGQEGEPPPPQPKLCDSYEGGVRAQCLDTVLRGSRQRSAEGRSAEAEQKQRSLE